MLNGTEVQDIINSGDLLRHSLQGVLSGSVCDNAQAPAAFLNKTQWTVRKAGETSSPLPGFMERHLSEALGAAPITDEHLESLLSAVGSLLPHLAWINRQAQPGQDSAFVERHRHAMIAGSGGLFECSTLTLGLALMMPETCYPYHQHPPAEFYLVLSPGDWYREDVGWWSPGAGGLVFNPPSCVHAMRSTDFPLLALWGLFHPEEDAS